MKAHQCGLLVLLLAISSCSFLNSFEPLKISGYTPQADNLPSGSTPSVSVSFSASPNHAKAESAFSLSVQGQTVAGDFSWSGNTLNFHPYLGLVEGCTYEMKEDSTVETDQGNSLAAAFLHRFLIGSAQDRPVLVSSTPANHAILATALTPIVLTFSKAMDHNSALTAFSISPSVSLVQSWDTGSHVLTLTPQASWPAGKELQVLITTDLKDTYQQAIGQSLDLRFTYPGTTTLLPQLVSVHSPTGTPSLTPPANTAQGSSTTALTWPINADIVLEFNKPVSLSSLQSALGSSVSLDYTLQPANALYAQTISLHLNSPLAWNRLIDLSLKTGISDQDGFSSIQPWYFWIKTNDNTYRPPQVVKLSWEGSDLGAYSNLSVADATKYTLRVYLSQGTSSSFQLASFLSNFALTPQGGYALDLKDLGVESTDTSDPTQKIFCLKLTYQVTLPAGTPPVALLNMALSKSYQDDKGNSPTSDYSFQVFLKSP